LEYKLWLREQASEWVEVLKSNSKQTPLSGANLIPMDPTEFVVVSLAMFIVVNRLLIQIFKNPFIRRGKRSSIAFNGRPLLRPLYLSLRAF
jgi:hypothetical protein